MKLEQVDWVDRLAPPPGLEIRRHEYIPLTPLEEFILRTLRKHGPMRAIEVAQIPGHKFSRSGIRGRLTELTLKKRGLVIAADETSKGAGKTYQITARGERALRGEPKPTARNIQEKN